MIPFRFGCRLAGSLLVLALAACGGGGGEGGLGGGAGDKESALDAPSPMQDGAGSPATAVISRSVDRYVGSWHSCQVRTDVSTVETLELTKAAPDTLKFTVASTTWADPGCMGIGAPLHQYTSTGTYTLAGVKSIGTEVVDRISLVHESGLAVKQIMVLRSDDTLHLGDLNQPMDADGYPETISTLDRFRKPW